MAPHREDFIWERRRQFVPNKRVSMLRLLRWRKMRRSNRRRKSLLAYWWAPLVTVAITGTGLFFAYLALPHGEMPAAKYLPKPGLYVVVTTQENVNALMRQENVRRIALALSDEDVGISLAQVAPEPPKRNVKRILPSISPKILAQEETFRLDAFLPPMATERVWKNDAPGVTTRIDTALRASNFTLVLPPPPTGVADSRADFWIRLNDSGAVVELLRFAPSGTETPWLQTLRKALLAGRGQAAAQGMVRIQWKTEVRE